MQCHNLHHVGIWADDASEMVTFLTEVLGFRVVTRLQEDSFQRIFVHLGDAQLFEILAKPEVPTRPDMPAHMAGGSGAITGIPHICFRVTDLPAWEAKIRARGYTINYKIPDQGYDRFELGAVRAIWFTGPSRIDFELFEFEEEYPVN